MPLTERPTKRAKLLSDASSSSESENEDTELVINQDFAKRFEHNSKRSELHRLEEKYGKPDGDANEDSDSSSSDESEDEGALATTAVDAEISTVLAALRSKDKSIYDKSHNFYTTFDPSTSTPATASNDKALRLRDYHRQNLLSQNGAATEDSNDDDAPQTFAEEQTALKQDLLAAASASDEEDDFFATKPGTAQRPPPEEKKVTSADVAAADQDPDKFLLEFVTSRAWAQGTRAAERFGGLESDSDSEDERADAYEHAFNMRFEDPTLASERIVGHSRDAASKYSVRRDEPTARAKAREREREAKDAARRLRDEEKGRLRNLRLEQAQEKLRQFKHAAGIRGVQVSEDGWEKFLEAAFDGDNWEKEMERRFGEEYYAQQDEEPLDGDEDEEKSKKRTSKPKWDDDIDIGDIVSDFEQEEDDGGFEITDDEGANGDEPSGEAEAEAEAPTPKHKSSKEAKKARQDAKAEARRERRKLEAVIDQKLSEEASVAAALGRSGSSSGGGSGARAGFRYRETSPTSFGLSARDILMADDTQLNAFAGLKKLAAFRPDDKKARDRKKLGKKARLRKWRTEAFGDPEGPKGSFAEYIQSRIAGEDDAGDDRKGKRKVRDLQEELDGAERKAKKRRSRKRKAEA